MSDHIGLRYLFDQPNLNGKQARWLAMINKFDFEVKYIKGKGNMGVDALHRRVKVNHLEYMSSYGTNLQDMLLQAGEQDVRYMDMIHMLQQSNGTSTDGGIGTGTGSGTGTGTGAGALDVDYCLTTNRLAQFRDMIYVLGNSELKKVIFSEFHETIFMSVTVSEDTDKTEEILLSNEPDKDVA